MNKEVRKGLTNYEVNQEGSKFVAVEWSVLIVLITYNGVMHFQWNIIATIVISAIALLILMLSPLYHAFGLLFSVGWGYIGYKCAHFLTVYTGGGNGLAVTIGVFSFIFFFLLTVGARMSGKEYFDDID